MDIGGLRGGGGGGGREARGVIEKLPEMCFYNSKEYFWVGPWTWKKKTYTHTHIQITWC